MKKVIFVFSLQSVSDIITNSSSELFVFTKETSVEEVKSVLDNIYPNWRKEYYDPQLLKDVADDDLYTYLDYAMYYSMHDYDRPCWRESDGDPVVWAKKQAVTYKKKIAKFFKDTFNLDIKFNDIFERADESYKQFLPRHLEQFRGSMDCYWYPQIKESAYPFLRENIPERILLFSKDENPNWDYQEKLMEVAERYHLG